MKYKNAILIGIIVVGLSYGYNKAQTNPKGILISQGNAPRYSAKGDSILSDIFLSSHSGGPEDVYFGRLNITKGIKIAEHTHTCTELLMVESGSGKLSIEDTVYILQKGDIIYIPKEKKHSFYCLENFSCLQIYGSSGPETKYFGWKKVGR